jgi:hypothetical protein
MAPAGRRIVFPWRVAGLPSGAVQVDVVFGEELADHPEQCAIPSADGSCTTSWVAGPEQSLAWKLLWLATDSYPQGKDLYDAVLLAEHVELPAAVFERTFELAGVGVPAGSPSQFVDRLQRIDWENFQAECPSLEGNEAAWRARLANALARDVPLASNIPDRIRPEWRTTDVIGVARGIADEQAFVRLPILADALMDAGCEDDEIIGHCRLAGPHGRFCWVVDLLLGTAKRSE